MTQISIRTIRALTITYVDAYQLTKPIFILSFTKIMIVVI